MKYFLISDNVDTLAAMQIVGINGVLAHEENEVKKAIEESIKSPDIGLVLITSKLYKEFQGLIFDYKLRQAKPLIIEMPDRHSGDNVADDIKAYIYEVVGVKI